MILKILVQETHETDNIEQNYRRHGFSQKYLHPKRECITG